MTLIMNYSSYQLSNMNSMPCYTTDNLSTPGVAYLIKLERSADDGWYLNSIATHHLTNNMANMNVKEEFNGSDQLIIGNSQGLPITYISDAFFTFRSSSIQHKHPHITLKDILLVLFITKNVLNISKLTSDNNLFVEFLGNIYNVKDSLKGQVLLRGLARK